MTDAGQYVRVGHWARQLGHFLARTTRRLVLLAIGVLAAVGVGLWSARYRRGRVPRPLGWGQAIEVSVAIVVVALIGSVLILRVGRSRSGRRPSLQTETAPPLSEPTLGPYLRDDGG